MDKKLQKNHVQQQGQSDCGVACLKSVLRYFGSDASFERLRELSGTSITGTTMLGLLQAGQELGLDIEGFEADMQSLKDCTDVTILHVIIKENLQHYVTCYQYNIPKDSFLIGDPSKNEIHWIKSEDLDKIWISKSLLLVKPTSKLVKTASVKLNNWTWLKNFFEPDFNILGIALSLGFAIAALGISTALFSQKLIDKILPAHDYLKLYSGIGMLCVLLFFRSFISYLREIFLLRQSFDFNLRINDFFFGSLLKLPKPFFDSRKTGELITRLNDTSRIQQTVSIIVGSVAIDALMVIIALISIFCYDWKIGLVISTWIPIYAFILNLFQPKILFGQREIMASYATNESNYIDTILGVGEIKISNQELFFQKNNQIIYSNFQQKLLLLGKIARKYILINEVVGTVFIITVIAMSSIFVLNGNLTTGAVMALIQMVGILISSASNLGNANIRLQEAKVAFERMFEFTSIKSEYSETDAAKSKILDFKELIIEDLSFRFVGRKRLLDNISLNIRHGELIAIIGESGSGKSTILQILQKFYSHEDGKIKVNGIDFDSISTHAWRSIVGVVPQEIKLFSGNVIDNIMLGEKINDPQLIIDFFKHYELEQFFEQFPNGYATILGENGVNISGGQKQLVGLARALWKKPQLLLLDEPSAALDRDKEQFMIRLLDKIKSEVAILLITHKASVARNADRIYILENGITFQGGNHKSLLEFDNLYLRSYSDYALV